MKHSLRNSIISTTRHSVRSSLRSSLRSSIRSYTIYPVGFLFVVLLLSCQNTSLDAVKVSGELKLWHKVTLEIEGPLTSEWDIENPFLDYKVEVLFTQGECCYRVPAYYAADGNAGESSSMEGNIWKVHFRPDATGQWDYKVLFRKGKNIAVLEGGKPVEPGDPDDLGNSAEPGNPDNPGNLGEPMLADGAEGSFYITESNKEAPDFRARGRISNNGKGYFAFRESGDIWIKNGADSPENFLAFEDFDQTSRFSLKKEEREGEANVRKDLHQYETHVSDWNEGDPTWQNGKGKGIIGALNYLHSVGVNSVYMLTMNILGDGKDVWPYTDYNERYRFDCSKLDQWEVVFDHMETLGMMMHLVLQETENEVLLDAGFTDVQRRVYLRELVARFGHHLAVSWNIGEENGPAHWTPVGQTDQQKKDMMAYLKDINPYPSVVVLHTHSDDKHQDEYLGPMLGFEHLDGPSMQIADPFRVHERISKWIIESEKAGKRWLVNLDEIGPAHKGVMPDSYDSDHDTIRQHCLWGTLMAGGGGVEWYFGYRYPHNDLNCENFRSRSSWWKQSTIATQFISGLPLEKMQSMDELVKVKDAYCLALPGELYAVYLPALTSQAWIRLDVPGDSGDFGISKGSETFESSEDSMHSGYSGHYTVKWFNPREGGELQDGSVTTLTGGGIRNPGTPPGNENAADWVVVLTRKTGSPVL